MANRKGHKVVGVKIEGIWTKSKNGKMFDKLSNFEDWTSDFVGKVKRISDQKAPRNTTVYKVRNMAVALVKV